MISEHALTKGTVLLQVQSSSVCQEIKSSPTPLWQHDDGDGADFSQDRINERKEEPCLPGVHYQIRTKIGFTVCRLEDKRSRSLKRLHRWPHRPTNRPISQMWLAFETDVQIIHDSPNHQFLSFLPLIIPVCVVLLCLISENKPSGRSSGPQRELAGRFSLWWRWNHLWGGAKTLAWWQIDSSHPTGFPQHWFVRWFLWL